MAKNRGKKKGRGKQPRGPGGARSHPASWSAADERAHYAALGCHVADVCRGRHRARSAPLGETHRRAMREHPWLLGIEDFDPSEYRAEDVTRIPEVAMDDGDGGDGPMTLTLTNVAGDATNACFVTVYDVDLCGADGTVLTSGATSVVVASGDADGGTDATITKERKCTTFIVLCPPRTFVHLCSLAPDQRRASAGREEPVASWRQVEIETDVQPWSSHPDVDDEHPYLLHFPFRGTGEASKGGDRAYRCTQAEHGQLTHFFHGNHHAVDFACPVGTPLYSPADGIVVDVRDKGSKGNDGVIEVSGVAAKNLFHWNSLMIRVDETREADSAAESPSSAAAAATTADKPAGPLFVELVHIQTGSCVVRPGDSVQRGQLVCRSGSVGFSPEPHLHLAAYRDGGDGAATVRVRFRCLPPAGRGCEDGRGGEEGGRGSAGGRGDRANATSFAPRAGSWYDGSGLS